MRASIAFVAALSVCPVGAHAQDADPQHEPTQGDIAVLRSRGRAVMHPSATPLKVSARESDDNDMRSKSPALKQGDLAPRSVAAEENYKRAIAMVQHRATYTTAPRAAAASTPEGSTNGADSPDSTVSAPTEKSASPTRESRTGLVWGSLGSFLLLVLGWSFVRRGS